MSLVDAIDPNQNLGETSNTLEFLLVSFCKHFSFKPKQAAGLLTQGGKYLAYIVAKGLKGRHEPIVGWYQDIYSQVKHLTPLVALQEPSGSVTLLLSSLKSGFISKSLDTAIWACRLYARLALEFFEHDLLAAGYDWFISEGGGLEGCLLCCRRYGPDIKSQAVSVLAQFAKQHFLEVFSMHLQALLPEPIHYFTIMNEFLPCLCEVRAAKQELIAAGVVDFWLDLGLREAEGKEGADLRLAALNFVCDLWECLPEVVESHEELATTILTLMKRGCRDHLKLMRVACLGKLFRLLDVFTREHNSYAPVVYKTLTFSLVENFEDLAEREFILDNFAATFARVESIPVGILVEPLIKQLQVSGVLSLNTVDFSFFLAVAKHPRLTVKNAVQLMDVLGKVYATELQHKSPASLVFLTLAARFEDSEPVLEYLFRFSRYGIRLAYNIATKRMSQEAVLRIYEDEKLTKEKTLMLQRNWMLEIVEKIVMLFIGPLNERIKAELLKTNASLKRMNSQDCPALMTLLKAFGEPTAIVQKYDEAAEQKAPNPSVSSASTFHFLPGRVLQDIEKARVQRAGQEEERREKAKKDQAALEQTKRALKKQLQKRRIEVRAVAPEFRGFSDEEREGVDIVAKRYKKALRVLFKKYASTGYTNKDQSSFDKLADTRYTLAPSEYTKLLKEQGVTMITPEEIAGLVRNYSHSLKKPQARVNFSEFVELLVHTALEVFSKPPKDLSHLAPAISFKSLIDLFRSHSTVPTKLFDEPDPGFGDRDVVQRLNKLLAKDPAAELPENYKRFEDREIDIRYEVPALLALSEAQSVAIEMLDGLLFKLFGTHLLEPSISYRSVFRAKGVLPKARVTVDPSQSLGQKFGLSEVGMTYHKGTYHPAVPAELNLSSGLKYELARLTGKYPAELLAECASLLADVIHSVEIGADHLVGRNERPKVQNRALHLRETLKYQSELEEFRKENRRKLRKQVIEERLKKAQGERQAKTEDEKSKRRAEEQLRARREVETEQRRNAERDKSLEKLAAWRAEREMSLKKQMDSRERKKQAEEDERKRKINDFLKQERQKIGSLLKDTFEQKNQKRREAEIAETQKLTLPSIKRQTGKIEKTASNKSFDASLKKPGEGRKEFANDNKRSSSTVKSALKAPSKPPALPKQEGSPKKADKKAAPKGK